ncbi:MAG TPA: hypothetical protein PK990_00495 [Salinivirgaceae bacterium]|nr:hypothetical protein [Salinivirgaceae bacterium]
MIIRGYFTRFFFLATSVLCFFYVDAQEQPKHPIKAYKAPDGKLFVNKTQPMFLWLSTSPDESSPKYRLESEQHKKYTNPFYFDTEGYNTIRTPSQVDTVTKQTVYPKQDIIFEIYTDSRPPKTQIRFDYKVSFKRGDKLFFKAETPIELTAYDEMSGVEKILYSIDRAPYQEYQNPIQLTEEKEYFLQYYSVDNVGNVEKIKTQTIVIDKTPPSSSIIIKKDRHENIVSGKTAIEIVTEDPGSGTKVLRYRLDNQQYRIYSGPIQTQYLSEGEHKLEFYAEDNLGNIEPIQTFDFYVDKTPPIVVEEILGNKFIANNVEYSSGRAKYKITAFDNKSGVKEIYYSINGGPNQLYTEPFYLESTKGQIVVRTFAIDNVNNSSTSGQSSQAKGSFYVDLAGPQLKYKFIGNTFYDRDTVFITSKTKIQLIAEDKESGLDFIEYSLNNQNVVRYSEPFVVENEGIYSLQFTAYDKVGNSNQRDFIFVIDNSAPEIFERFSILPIGTKIILDKQMNVYPNQVILFLSATDAKAGLQTIRYRINQGQFMVYSEPIKRFEPGRDYKIEIIAVDKLGNEMSRTIEFSVN